MEKGPVSIDQDVFSSLFNNLELTPSQLMIGLKTGNVLTKVVEALVNTINCVGDMGFDLAPQVKKDFPEKEE